MPTIYDWKPRFQALLRPVVAKLAANGVTPNQVTWAAVALSLLMGTLLLAFPSQRWPLLLLPAVLFLRMALNAIDGLLAREHAMQTAFGGILNELGDVFSDVFLYLPFAALDGIGATWVVAFVLLAAIGEMAGVLGVVIGASRRYDGPLGKSDRAFAMGAVALLLGAGLPPGLWLSVLGTLLCLMAMATIVHRVRSALREVR